MNLIENFASCVFTDSVMRERVDPAVFSAYQNAVSEGTPLERPTADAIAAALREWAVEKGATHYTHWFQPMTGVTAEKHEAFLSPDGNGGAIMDFTGKNLIKGEADASAFPSGGLRATFEARGYTAWDPTSHPFLKEGTLCIPTAFWSYNGDVLDMKTPLLRSCAYLDRVSVRLLRLLGDTRTHHVTAQVGSEQEYFLIDRDLFYQRPDLIYTGRTLFGARPARGQEGSYSGALRDRVRSYMADLDNELWKLGIYAHTEHAEAAPAQHELAPVFNEVNTACDHNQLTMELMRKVALRHGMECLLHEKPFRGVNGSGKHNNWSLSTDGGENLLEPGSDPAANIRFLLFFSAVIRAVDLYNDLLYISVANAANDHRLGGHEAPPAIISVYTGTVLEDTLKRFERHDYDNVGEQDYYDLGPTSLPRFKRDTADRNRTSPFAFTGNKFEFRMPGSSAAIAWPNTVINAIVGESIAYFCDELEKSSDIKSTARHLVRETYRRHGRIIFNGNNYSPEWLTEADRRGICRFSSSEDALRHLTDEKNVNVFESAGIFSRTELMSRQEILLNDYVNVLATESRTLIDMTRRDILPAVTRYSSELSDAVLRERSVGIDDDLIEKDLRSLVALRREINERCTSLDEALSRIPECDTQTRAGYARKELYTHLEELRESLSRAELVTADDLWPYPTYGELLHLKDDGGIK